MVYVLIFLLFLLFLITLSCNKGDIIEPSSIFCASFTFLTIWAIIYSKVWNLDLHLNTFLVIFGGVLEFVAIAFGTKKIFTIEKHNKKIENGKTLTKIDIETWKKIIVIMFEIFVIFYSIYAVVQVTNGSFSNIAASIHKYDVATKFKGDTSIYLPKLLNLMRIIVLSLGYWFSYILVNNYLKNKKIDILSLIIISLCLISSMLTGGRGGSMNLILACVAYMFILLNKKNNFKKFFSYKIIIKVFCLGVVCLLLFQNIGIILGRNDKSTTTLEKKDYLAIYCGAELKNLDTFLQENKYTIRNDNKVWGSQTFIHVIQWIAPKLGIDVPHYMLDLPFRSINGRGLGNVYTTFYPYIYDFGYLGMVILVGIMAIITQYIYEKCKKVKLSDKPSIMILVYGYIFHTIVLSFFSNKFYEDVFNKGFLEMMVFWCLFNIFFCKIKIKNTKNLT